MDGAPSTLPIDNWDVNAVAAWLASIGFSQYEKRFRGTLATSALV